MPDYSHKSRKYVLIGFLVVLLGTNLVTYFMFGHRPPAAPPEQDAAVELPLDLGEELRMFGEVLDLLNNHYLEPLELPLLVRGAVKGAVQAVGDPRTVFYDAREYENFAINTSGSFAGVGVKIVEVDEDIVVLETIPDTPAERAGLRPGDRLRSAAGEELTGQGLDRAVELLRGPRGTAVEVSVERPGDGLLFLTLERDEVELPSVTSRFLARGLGYIRIETFNSLTGDDFEQQLLGLEQEGLERGLILDLRDNAGGPVDEAIKVARLLVPEGEITRLVGRSGEIRDIHYSSGKPKPYPLVVLVNEETASAAEIVAGALRDRDVAVLVGTRTYGKATVQHLERLPGGNALLITVAKYLTPKGRDIHGQGLEPDVVVEQPDALQYYRHFLPGRLAEGDYGSAVEFLQEMLSELGYPVSRSGFFDRDTAGALSAFQADTGLETSGVYDDLTWIRMREALEKTAAMRDPQLDRAVDVIRHRDPLVSRES